MALLQSASHSPFTPIHTSVPASYMQDASLPTGNYLEFRGVVVVYARREEEEEEVGITLPILCFADWL